MTTKIRRNEKIKIVKISENGQLIHTSEVHEYELPFENLLDLVKTYFNIYKENDLYKLKYFIQENVKPEESGLKFASISPLDMFSCIVNMYFHSIDPDLDDDWCEFNANELEEILKDPFFDEYNETVSFIKTGCKRIYPMIEAYTFFRLQAFATTVLPKDFLWDMHHIWTFEDFIEQIFDLGWHKTISIVYKSLGIHWFSSNGENDPIMYKWACLAVLSCAKCNAADPSTLKKDLNTIYGELLIAFTVRNTLDKNADLIKYVFECITSLDESHILQLENKISTLKRDNSSLIDENRQLSEGLDRLRYQMQDIQKDAKKNDYEKVEEMAYRLYCLSPQNDEINDKLEVFKSIWNKLDINTKKDIKLSFSLFEEFDSTDLALFPLLRSLEYEFARNYFDPFFKSKIYSQITNFSCTDPKYLKTHESLLNQNNIYPTIGSIPHIGKALSDEKAKKSSGVLSAFVCFLGNKRNVFASICNDLSRYSFILKNKRYKLKDIRNGIAHGDINITAKVDDQCYEQVCELLYNPPLQILLRIIQHSFLLNQAHESFDVVVDQKNIEK